MARYRNVHGSSSFRPACGSDLLVALACLWPLALNGRDTPAASGRLETKIWFNYSTTQPSGVASSSEVATLA